MLGGRVQRRVDGLPAANDIIMGSDRADYINVLRLIDRRRDLFDEPDFTAALNANPAAALKAEGIDVPDGVAVTVVENTDKHFHLVLPPTPTDELSAEALDAVVGAGRGSPFAAKTMPPGGSRAP